jgi:predicted nucleotidyltransferase
MNKKKLKSIIKPILQKNGIVKAALFGSIARGESTNESDVDLLVKFPDGKSLLDLIGLKLELEDILGRDVDVLTYDSVHPLLKETILNEQEIIYEA